VTDDDNDDDFLGVEVLFWRNITVSFVRVRTLQMRTAGSPKLLIPIYQAVCRHNPEECDVSSFN